MSNMWSTPRWILSFLSKYFASCANLWIICIEVCVYHQKLYHKMITKSGERVSTKNGYTVCRSMIVLGNFRHSNGFQSSMNGFAEKFDDQESFFYTLVSVPFFCWCARKNINKKKEMWRDKNKCVSQLPV